MQADVRQDGDIFLLSKKRKQVNYHKYGTEVENSLSFTAFIIIIFFYHFYYKSELIL